MKRHVWGGAALVAAGALAGIAAMKVHISFDDQPVKAAPPVAPVQTGIHPALPPPSPAQVADARAISRTFVQVAEQLKPSVVAIMVEKGGGGAKRFSRGRMRGANPFQGTPFEQFFGLGGEGGLEVPKQVGAGSGVVIESQGGQGYILTNNHVVEGADLIKVKFSDGREIKGTIMGADPKTDLAVVKVSAEKLVAARMGDSERLQVGEWVIAIGNPYGFDHTVTVGVISAKGRGLGAGQYEDYLQTDAAINPGNSGGPLISLDGEVIGINTAIKGVGTMIGFAIPTSMARPIAQQLIKSGHVRRPYLGILMQELTPELATSLGAGAPQKGALVGQVETNSPAARAGIQPGDVIVRLDGQEVEGSKAVQKAVLQRQLGQRIAIDIWRSGRQLTLSATAGEHPGDAGERRVASGSDDASPKGHIGLQLESLTPQLAEQLGVRDSRGAVVAGVDPDSPASEAGVREGDVIVEVDRRAVASAEDASRALRAPRQGGHLLRIKRGDGALFVVVPAA